MIHVVTEVRLVLEPLVATWNLALYLCLCVAALMVNHCLVVSQKSVTDVAISIEVKEMRVLVPIISLGIHVVFGCSRTRREVCLGEERG